MGSVSFSEELDGWLRSEGAKTVGGLSEVFAEKSFAVTIVVLMFVPALPAPTGGVTHLLEVMTAGLGVQMMLGRRRVWLPQRWSEHDLGRFATSKTIPFMVRWVRRLERISRPRLAGLYRQPILWRALGLFVLIFALAAAVAPPFTGLDTLPSLGAMLVGLSIVLEDIVVLIIGLVLGGIGVVLVVTIGAVVVNFAWGWL